MSENHIKLKCIVNGLIVTSGVTPAFLKPPVLRLFWRFIMFSTSSLERSLFPITADMMEVISSSSRPVPAALARMAAISSGLAPEAARAF